MANLGTLLYQIGADLTELRKSVDEVNKASKKMKEDLDKANQSAEAMNTAFGYMKTAVAGIGVAAFARDLLQTGMALDGMNNKLRYSVGSAQAAANSYKMLRSESDRLGLNVMTAADAFGSFAIAAKDTSLEGNPVKEVFLAIAEASTVMNLSNEQASGAMLAMSQIMSKGKVQAEELRGQLGERIPGAFQIAARAMNMTTAELDKFMADGKLTANDFLPKFAAQLRKEMSGAVGEAAQSTRANLNRLENAWLDLKKAMLDTGFLSVVTTGMQALTKAIEAVAAAAEREAEARRKTNTPQGGSVGGVTPGEMKANYFKAMGIPTEKKFPFSKVDRTQIPGLGAYEDQFPIYEDQFLIPSPEVAEAAKKFWDDQKAAAKEFRKGIRTSTQIMEEEFTKIYNLVIAGEIDQQEALKGYAKARQEYEKGYPVEAIQNQIKMNQELSKAKLEQLDQEMKTAKFNLDIGKSDFQTYASEMNRIYDQMAAHRIATLQAEKAQTQKMMEIEAGDPTKSWMEKDLIKGKYSAQLQNIDNEIAAVQNQRQQQAQQLYLEQEETILRIRSMEVSALEEIYQFEKWTIDQRMELGNRLYRAKKQLIELEKQANIRSRMTEGLAGTLAKIRTEKAEKDVWKDQAANAATIAQLNNQYAQINGTLEEQLKTQRALNTANAEYKAIASSGLPEIADMYREIAKEQNKLLDLRQSGTWGQGFVYEMDKVAKNMPTAFDEGRESVNQLKKAIDDASGSLADMFMGRKVDAAQFFQQLIRDMIKVQIQGMLMKTVFGEGSGGGGFLGSILGGVGSILGGLFGGGSAGFTSAGGTSWNPSLNFPEHRASGGEAEAGTLYRVNELGMEWFKPKVKGTVIPLSADTNAKGVGSAGSFEFKPSFRVEVINNGSPVNAEEGPTRQEGETWVKTVHLSALKNDEDYRAANRSLISSGRR